MSLLSQIEERSKEISTDSYSMSVGELLTMYKDRELNLHPEFQRLFRWSPEQKSRLIESLLLGIPLPSIFVAQRANGTWEIVDGLQRLSTLFELAGELKTRDGVPLPQLILTRTKYLPDLEGLRWNSENDHERLPDDAKLRIKRSRIDVNIVLATSDASAKYELFQRLNTGGEPATDQEVRNAILAMISRDFFDWITELGAYENFRACVPLTERALDEQFDLELVARFLVFRSLPEDQIRDIPELGAFITDHLVGMAESPDFDRDEAARAFHRTFDTFARLLGEASFKKFDAAKQRPTGAMLISIFEVLAIGLGYYAGDTNYVIDDERIINAHHQLPQEVRFTGAAGSGIRASTRIPATIGLGRQYFRS